MFGWFRTSGQVQQELARAKELLGLQDDVIASMEIALVDANKRADINFLTGRNTIAALLLTCGGEVLISPEILEVVKTADFEIKSEVKDNGSVILSMTTAEPTPETGEKAS